MYITHDFRCSKCGSKREFSYKKSDPDYPLCCESPMEKVPSFANFSSDKYGQT